MPEGDDDGGGGGGGWEWCINKLKDLLKMLIRYYMVVILWCAILIRNVYLQKTFYRLQICFWNTNILLSWYLMVIFAFNFKSNVRLVFLPKNIVFVFWSIHGISGKSHCDIQIVLLAYPSVIICKDIDFALWKIVKPYEKKV